MEKRLKRILIIVIAILMIPLIAMQLTNEVNWSLFDFIVAGTLLFITVSLIELVLWKVRSKPSRIILSITILAGLLLIWVELAVGIFGTPFAGS